jgi:hypothetical protein
MCTLDSFLSRMGFTVAITVFSMATTAKERLKPQKQYTPVQSACFPSFGTITVTARRSGRQVQVQSSTCTSGSGQTTVAARRQVCLRGGMPGRENVPPPILL